MEHQPRQVEYANIGEGDKAIALHYFNHCCCYCGRKLIRKAGFDNSLEMEHYISVDAQKDNHLLIIDGSISNRVPSCRKCNRQKSNKNPEEWIKETFENYQEIIDNIEMFFAMQEEYLFT